MSDDISVLSKVVGAKLNGYTERVRIGVRKIIDDKSERFTRELKRNSPRRKKGKGKRSGGFSPGSYARSWRNQVETNDFTLYERLTYNRKHYPLTHLLEKGHAKRGGGRVAPVVHIAPLAERIEKEVETDIINLISKESRK